MEQYKISELQQIKLEQNWVERPKSETCDKVKRRKWNRLAKLN